MTPSQIAGGSEEGEGVENGEAPLDFPAQMVILDSIN